MKDLIDDFKQARLDLIKVLKDFPKEKREVVLFGEWSLKDLVGHISGWNIAATNAARSLEEGNTPEWVKSINDFNKENVERREKWSWEKVSQEFLEASKALIEEYERLPRELWEKKYWSERKYTPLKMFKIELKHLKNIHLPEMLKYLAK